MPTYSGDDPKDFGTPAGAPRSRDDFRQQISSRKTSKPTPKEAWDNKGTTEPRWPFRPKNKQSKVSKRKRGRGK